MKRVIIFGNSGSGKSTLSKKLEIQYGLESLDLDTLAWTKENPPNRRRIIDSQKELDIFTEKNKKWVIEGCYADLIQLIVPQADNLIFLNPGVEACIQNCKKRPWEPHKYESPELQNKNLDMLLSWVREYPIREDEFSLTAHQKIYENFPGKKHEYNTLK